MQLERAAGHLQGSDIGGGDVAEQLDHRIVVRDGAGVEPVVLRIRPEAV
jgi:hypothetical protein